MGIPLLWISSCSPSAQVMSISVTASRDDQARFQKADAELDQPPHSTQAGFKVPIAIGKLGKNPLGTHKMLLKVLRSSAAKERNQ